MSTEIFQSEKLDDEVKALWDQAHAKPGEKTPDPEKKDAPADDKKEPEGDKKPPEDKKPDEPAKPEPEPEKKPEPEPAVEPPKEEDWKHKYEVLKGKYDAEVPRLAFDLAESNKKSGELEKRVVALETKPKDEKPPEPKPLTPKLQKLKEEYPDIFDAVSELNKVSVDEAVNKVTEKVTAKVDKTVGEVKETVAKSDRERFEETIRLDPEVGKEIDNINRDPEFENWLKEIDEYTGVPRGALARDAIERMDKPRTLTFFKNFKKEKSGSSTPPKKEEPVNDNPPKKKKEPDIAPPRGGGGGTPDDTKDKGKVTLQDLSDHLQSIADGKWQGKEAEAEKKTLELHSALFKKKKT